MTPQEALDLLNQASAQVAGNRDVHVKIQEAVNLLQEAIEPPKADPKPDDLGDDE